MVFLGGTPAALIGVISILAGWLRLREEPHDLLVNVADLHHLPAGRRHRLPRKSSTATGITAADPAYYVLVFGAFLVALAINFTMIGAYTCYLERSSFFDKVRTVLVPLLPSELAAALMAVGVAFIYNQIGLAGVALFGIVLVTFQYLLGALLQSQERAEELEVRTKQLASFQVGMLSALLRTLDLRDQMTARHSAAVARYSRAIAQRAGFSRQEEELVHIAALLHDIGKFILPDRILKANVPLTDEDWMLIRRHPQQGARVVSSLDGYGPVAEIILAHHERIDGKGYPRGLEGDDIPELARIISVADTYDVMTARDSYRTPISSYDAIQELRRVAGEQLDARFVEIFIELLEGKDVSFRHGEEADFEKELALEARIAETASPGTDGVRPLPGRPASRRRLSGQRSGRYGSRRCAPSPFRLPARSGSRRSPSPEIGAADEALVRVEASGICGSDLHIYHGRVPVEPGFTIGHEYVGTVLAAGDDVERVAVGDRVLGCFHTACAHLRRLPARRLPPLRARAHLRPRLEARRPARAPRPSSCSCRAPNLTLRRVPEGMSDEVALFAGDVMGTGYPLDRRTRGCAPGDTVAVLGPRPGRALRGPGGARRPARPASSRSTRSRRGSRWRPSSARSRSTSPRRTRSGRCAPRPRGAGSTSSSTRSATRPRWRWRSASPATPAPSRGSAPTPARARSRSASPG